MSTSSNNLFNFVAFKVAAMDKANNSVYKSQI